MSDSEVIGGVRVSNADKVWWPDEGITKGDVARFHDELRGSLVPWLRERPMVAERCPDGSPPRGRAVYGRGCPLAWRCRMATVCRSSARSSF